MKFNSSTWIAESLLKPPFFVFEQKHHPSRAVVSQYHSMKLALCMWGNGVFDGIRPVSRGAQYQDLACSDQIRVLHQTVLVAFLSLDEPHVDPKYEGMATALAACLETLGFRFHWFQMVRLFVHERHVYNSFVFTSLHNRVEFTDDLRIYKYMY